MGLARDSFGDRRAEIEQYLEFLKENELPGVHIKLTSVQINVMKSSVFLQLYNLVESTVALSYSDVSAAISHHATVRLQDLSTELRDQWVRIVGRTATPMNSEARHRHTSGLLADILDSKPVQQFDMNTGGGGNWDNRSIHVLGKKIGLDFEFPDGMSRGLNSEFYNSEGPMVAVRMIRNDLAHGNVSFGEIGQLKSVAELVELFDVTVAYLEAVIAAFEKFISSRRYLVASLRV